MQCKYEGNRITGGRDRACNRTVLFSDAYQRYPRPRPPVHYQRWVASLSEIGGHGRLDVHAKFRAVKLNSRGPRSRIKVQRDGG